MAIKRDMWKNNHPQLCTHTAKSTSCQRYTASTTRQASSWSANLWHSGGFSCPCTKWCYILLIFKGVAQDSFYEVTALHLAWRYHRQRCHDVVFWTCVQSATQSLVVDCKFFTLEWNFLSLYKVAIDFIDLPRGGAKVSKICNFHDSSSLVVDCKSLTLGWIFLSMYKVVLYSINLQG